MRKTHSGQKFKFEIPLIFRLIDDIKKETIGKNELKIKHGLGDNKIDSFVEYMQKIDAVIKISANTYELTNFGEAILKLKDTPSFYEPLILHKLSRSDEDGGHLFFSILMNDILHDIAFKIDNVISKTDIKKLFEMRYSDLNLSDKNSLFLQALNGGLADKYTGFGKMGIVVAKSGQYEVTGFIPDRLITAYVLYDNWPKDRTAIKRDDLYTMPYFPARLFFMVPRLFEEQINHLVDERILYYEREGGLNQITLAPNLSPDKILDRIIENA